MSVPEAAEACGGKEPVLVGRNPRLGERLGVTVGRPAASPAGVSSETGLHPTRTRETRVFGGEIV